MKSFLTPLQWIDALVQKVVDSCAFFLARRMHIRISWQRYTIITFFILSTVGDAVLAWTGRGSITPLLILPVILFVWLRTQHIVLKQDEMGEEAGVSHTHPETPKIALLIKGLGLGMILFAALFPFPTTPFKWLQGAFLVLLGYHMRTPNIPPANEETVLEPAKQSA